jgi:ubiquinone/menaquinone biosynthesis C-methylase UbiE
MNPDAAHKESEAAVAAASYQAVAPEYYDLDRHPTCANFRDASVQGLRPWLRRYCTSDARILEVGAGKSVLLEYLNETGVRLSRLLVTDASPAMLNYSRDLGTNQHQLVVASADQLPALDNDLTAVVASLGDPYNEFGFWREAWRVLRPNGRVLFTTPTHEWATAYRKGGNQNVAEFELTDGRKINAPSLILEVDEQLDLMRSAGFRTLAIQEVALDDIDRGRISYKLTLAELKCAPIVRAYLAQKPG